MLFCLFTVAAYAAGGDDTITPAAQAGERTQSELNELAGRLQTMQANLAALRRQVDELPAASTDDGASQADFDKALSDLSATVASLQAQVTDGFATAVTETELGLVTTDLVEVETKITELKTSVGELQGHAFRIGLAAGGMGGVVPVQDGLVASDPAVVPGGEATLGAYVMYAADGGASPYLGLRGALGLGSMDSYTYTGGAEAGWLLEGAIGLGGNVGMLVRDLLVVDGTFRTRYIGAEFGPELMLRLSQPAVSGTPVETSFVVAPVVGYGGFVRDPDRFWSGGLRVEVRVGLGTD